MEKIVIIDFGSQYSQLIARRIREAGVFSEMISYKKANIEFFTKSEIKGIVLSGGPDSVYNSGAPIIDKKIFKLNKPILAICYGMQLTQYLLGGKVISAHKKEYGKSKLKLLVNSKITQNIPDNSIVWMSHGDEVETLADGFLKIACTESSIAIAQHKQLPIYNFQFHPEVLHTKFGKQFIDNFLNIGQFSRTWNMTNYSNDIIKQIKTEVQDKKVILGLSGGVDSTVTAVLINQAIGNQLTCVFVDTGLLRYEEAQKVMQFYQQNFSLNIKLINAQDSFLKSLKNITEPEVKRKVIGKLFIEHFEIEWNKLSDIMYLAQGTIYPDIIESSDDISPSNIIKSHHNVGGIPDNLKFKLLEPLSSLFKDEVRKLGLELGIPKDIVFRHPFPGPGLAIRILGEVTKEKVLILQQADAILIEELQLNNLYELISQALVVLLPCKTVGVMGDERTYEYVAAIRCVNTNDFMTASVSRLTFEFLEKVATRIVNEVAGINRIVYDITSKPPATIEWE